MSSSSSASVAARLRILSMNLWFDPLRMVDRMRAFTRVVCSHAPDVLLCQEVTPLMLRTLQQLLQQQREHQFDLLCDLVPADRAYGEVMFVRKSGNWSAVNGMQPFHVPFENSYMERGLHVVEVRHTESDRRALISTTHLESLASNSALRLAQLHASLQLLLSSGKPFVLGGDLNLSAADDSVLRLPAMVDDAWQSAGAVEKHRWTWDTIVNTNLSADFRARCRFDRFLFHKPLVNVTDFSMVAKEPIVEGTTPMSPTLFCSDHWGILADFNVLSA